MHLYELISSFPSCQLADGKENFMNFGEQHGIIRFLFSSHPILIYEDSKNYYLLLLYPTHRYQIDASDYVAYCPAFAVIICWVT